MIKSKDRGLLDKTKINKDVLSKGFKLGQGNDQEREYLESEVIDIRGDFKKDKSERKTVKAFSIDDVDGKIIKIVGSGRTEKGQIEVAGKMREAEISRLETVNGADLIGLKESLEKNAENKKNFSETEGLLSSEGREKIKTKLNEEENQTKERIKEREEKLAEETKKFSEPLENRLKETMKMENILSKALDSAKEVDSGLRGKIKEYEDGINKALKNFSGEVGADIVKDLQKTKDGYEVQSKKFEESRIALSSRLDVLKSNKKEIEVTLSRVNNIGKTKQEIADIEKIKKEIKAETGPTEEKKDDEREEKTWDETRDEVWGLKNTIGKKEKAEDEEEKEEGRKEQGESKIEEEIEVEENEKMAEKVFTHKEIEEIAMKELKKLGIMSIKDRTMREQITGNVIMAVEAMIAKSKKHLEEEDIKKEVGDWYRKYSKNYFKKGTQPKI